MVYLRPGSTVDYESLGSISGMLRQLAILEFVNIYHKNLNRFDPIHLFGDEIEYLIVNLDHSNFKSQLLPIYPHLYKFIQDKRHLEYLSFESQRPVPRKPPVSNYNPNHAGLTKECLSINCYLDNIMFNKSSFNPEACSYMVETVPDEPYSLFSNYVVNIRKSIYNRRKRLELILLMLGYNHSKLTNISNFARYGCKDCVYFVDSKFQKVFTENLDPRFIEAFDITITPINKIYDMILVNRFRRRGAKTYIEKFRAYDSSRREADSSSEASFSEKEALLDEHKAISGLSRMLDGFNNYKLFSLLDTHQRKMGENIANAFTEVIKHDDLLNYIMEQAFIYDSKPNKGDFNSKLDIRERTKPNLKNAVNSLVRDGFVGVDSVGGLCSLQVTFSCSNLEEARYLYDQLIVLTPLFLSLSAATVAYNGVIANTDTRWPIITQEWSDDPITVTSQRYLNSNLDSARRSPDGSVTPTNRNSGRTRSSSLRYNRVEDESYFYKGRCSTNSLFISKSQFCIDNYRLLNDIRVDCDFEAFVHFTKMGVDPILGRLISHNLVYEPLSAYLEDYSKVDCRSTDKHYQIFNDTNWTSVRLNHPKLLESLPSTPRANSASQAAVPPSLPWRVEFRPLEIQLTDEENVMFISVVSYVVKVLKLRRLNLYMPISMIDINTETSAKIESCHKCSFYFRDDVTSNSVNVSRYSLHDILFGQVGLFSIVLEHLHGELAAGEVSKEFHDQLLKYFTHLKQLTLGNTPTNATKLRRFIHTHPSYTGDGSISDHILYDIIQNLTSY